MARLHSPEFLRKASPALIEPWNNLSKRWREGLSAILGGALSYLLPSIGVSALAIIAIAGFVFRGRLPNWLRDSLIAAAIAILSPLILSMFGWAVALTLVVALLVGLFTGFILGWRNANRLANYELSKLLESSSKLLELDERLLNLLPDLVKSDDIEEATERLLRGLLDRVLSTFEDVSRTMILVPGGDEYLRPWVHRQMSYEVVKGAAFYVGENPDETNKRRGVAGEAFVSGMRKVVHLKSKDGEWIPDDSSFIVIEEEGESSQLPFRSFVADPILGQDNSCLGVLCLDSMNEEAFDSEDIGPFLDTLGKKIRVILRLKQLLEVRARKSKK